MTTMSLFLTQFCALCRKNWIILWRHRWINLARCLLLPIGYAAFMAQAQNFFQSINNFGPGDIAPLLPIPTNLLGLRLVWAPPPSAATNATVSTFLDELMNNVLQNVTGQVIKVANNAAIEANCPQNLNALSDCFCGVLFNTVDPSSYTLNYTLRGDSGLTSVNVQNPYQDDVATRYLPLQWAIESNFIAMTTGTLPPTPYNWEYTNVTNVDATETKRLSYLGGIRELIVLALFFVFLGIVYQLPGSMASERANLLTAHLEAMGCKKSSRILSWHLSLSGLYLPAWIFVAVIWQHFIWTRTNAGLLIISYIITGMSLASWTQLIQVPFGGAPTLAAITSAFLAIILAIGALILRSRAVLQIVLNLIFPPMFFTFFTKAISAWEERSIQPNILKISPDGDAPVLALLIVTIIDLFLFPLISVWLEDRLYGYRDAARRSVLRRLFGRRPEAAIAPLPSEVAVKLSDLRKTYSTKRFGIFGRGKPVTAIEDLSFEVPKGEIFCLLGRNGAAKSTTLSAIARLINTSGGTIQYGEDLHIGIASQKDVLWDELTPEQHIRLWRAIKTTGQHQQHETDIELLDRCDLTPKLGFLAKNLSGGQKRKLQLAVALAGGSNLLLLDEISSGLDPLSRRAIWKLITDNRGKTTIILTTHFLDEADYLGDQVAILKSPGRLLALDNPVAFKNRLGRGYTLSVETSREKSLHLLADLQKDLPGISTRNVKQRQLFLTGCTDIPLVQKLVNTLHTDRQNCGTQYPYQVNSATLEEVFLDVNAEEPPSTSASTVRIPLESSSPNVELEKDIEKTEARSTPSDTSLTLSPGRTGYGVVTRLQDAWTIFLKRLIVLRRSWLLPLIAIVVVVCAASIPLTFISTRVQTCAIVNRNRIVRPTTYPISAYPLFYSPVVLAPASYFSPLLGLNASFATRYVSLIADNATFVSDFQQHLTNITFGGVSVATDPTQPSLFAWEGSGLLLKGLSVLNILTNGLLDRTVPSTTNPFRITLNFQYLASPSFASTGDAIKWLAFFGLGMAIWPAFSNVYPTLERASNIRANQYSNGASPAALWLGHLLHEIPGIFIVSTIITVIFGVGTHQFNGIGVFFVCFVLYGISATLYSFLAALFLNSALASWALVAGVNVVLFLLYIAGYLLTLTYDLTADAAYHINIIHFTFSLINPIPNILRAAMVSVNLFALLCDGLGNQTSKPYSDILQFGGPILYMTVQSLFAFAILVYVDSGSPIPLFLRPGRKTNPAFVVESKGMTDVIQEKERIENGSGSGDAIKVMRLRKKYGGAPTYAVDDVSFGVSEGETFALIGPNGAGKTTTLACIRGLELPTSGDVSVEGNSIVHRRNAARSLLGVCPQFNAIDSSLTVRQHLWLFGRLRGVPSAPLKKDVQNLLVAAGLAHKAEALATSLSGGNQRKLLLAIALIGDRPVVLIDEFSSGVDPFSKREAWATLAALTKDRAVVMTTHSMEEVDALASRVGIIASRMLAVGTPQSLKSRFATYEIHLTAAFVEPMIAYLQNHGFAKAHRSLDTITRISVPGIREDDMDKLLGVLESARIELCLDQLTLHEASTETAFLSIVRQHNIKEEEGHHQKDSRSFWERMIQRK